MKIGTREIGPGHPVFIVAESGLNHDGDLVKALQMVRAAKTAGADAFKIACFSADCFTTPGAAQWNGEDQHAMFRRHELSRAAVLAIADECRKVGLVFFGTPDCLGHAAWLVQAGAPVLKVGSDDLTNTPLIEGVARFGLPMILSTGMASEADIDRALGAVRARGGPPPDVALLQCTSMYPCGISAAELFRLPSLGRFSGEPLVGFSDHTPGDSGVAAMVAVGLGAAIIEKHITPHAQNPGPDHSFSCDLRYMFEAFCSSVRKAEAARGTLAEVWSTDAEWTWTDERPDLEMRQHARRVVVAARDLVAGTKLEPRHFAIKRDGRASGGLMPYETDKLVSRTLYCDVPTGRALALHHLAPEASE